MEKINLQCFCGDVKGEVQVVSVKASFHVHCFCRDCQQFASFLGNEDKILDHRGGSELFQTYPSYVKLTQGEKNLTYVQLREKGLYRWYTKCCHTPVANTMTISKVPFVGLSLKMMPFSSETEKLRVLGPVIMKAFGRSARGEKPKDAHETFPRSFMPRIVKFMIIGLFTSRYRPSPFFKDGQPVAAGKVLA